MQNPLTSLDELIWQQFEKVTRYAHKNYGWDKYDLAEICNSATAFSLLGGGIYDAIATYSQGGLLRGTVAALAYTAVSITLKNFGKDTINKWRKSDLKEFLATGAIREPTFSGIRPAMLSMPTILYGVSALAAAGNNILGDKNFYDGQYRAAVTLGFFMEGTALVSFVSLWYFEGQLFTPSSAKRPFWKTTYERIKNKFSPKPTLEPAAEPISKYSLEHHLEATNL